MSTKEASVVHEYEAAFVLDANESVFKASLDKLKALFAEKGAEILSETDGGIKRLAYVVKRHTEARYFYFRVKVDGSALKGIDAELRLYEDVLKYLFIKQVFKKKRFPAKEQAAPAAV